MSRVLFIFIILFMALQGCVTSKEIFLADGSRGHNVDCSGSGMNYSNCLDKAGEICGARGYYLLNQQGDVVPFSTAIREFSASARSSIGYLTHSGSIVKRNLLIKCR